jgi:hypothetical protein
MDAEVIIRRKSYPNGEPFLSVDLGMRYVGSIDLTDGGYVPCGCRKPRASLGDATLWLLQAMMRRHLDEAAVLARAIERLPRPLAVDPR